MRRLLRALAPLALTAVIAAGCGGSGGNKSTGYQSAPKKTSTVGDATIEAKKTGLGTILVDSTGRTFTCSRRTTATGAAARARAPLPGRS